MPHSQLATLPAVTTKVQRNKNMGKLQAGYLFPEASRGGQPGSLSVGFWVPPSCRLGAACPSICTLAHPATAAPRLVPQLRCTRQAVAHCPPVRPPGGATVQIARRRKAHQEANPDAKIISLGIGDTTEPIPPFIVEAMKAASEGLGTLEGYSG